MLALWKVVTDVLVLLGFGAPPNRSAGLNPPSRSELECCPADEDSLGGRVKVTAFATCRCKNGRRLPLSCSAHTSRNSVEATKSKLEFELKQKAYEQGGEVTGPVAFTFE
jgi:hypothetical protein